MIKINNIALFLIFLPLFFIILPPGESLACGTVKNWVNIYLNDKHRKQDEALYKINCKPAVTTSYKATPTEQESLAKMISKGLKSLDYCDRSLATKNFFLFDQLFWLQGSDVYDEIVTNIEARISRPVHTVTGELSLYEGEEREDYCARVNFEIKGMKWVSESKCITDTCKQIEISAFKEKLGRIASFTRQTDKCTVEKSETSLRDRIVEVQSKTLTLRKKPAPTGTVLGKLKRDDLLLVKSEKNGWLHVINKKCKEGWVGGYLTKNARGK